MRLSDFAFRLEDVKNADINDPQSWPVSLKMLLIVIGAGAILFAGYYYIIKDQIEELERFQKKELSLKKTYLKKKELAINLPAYRVQMEEIKEKFGFLLQQLPNKTEVPELLIDITQAGLGEGLKFNLFDPGGRRVRDFYAELPIKIRVNGSYHEFGMFVSEIAALSRIVTINNLTIKRQKGKGLTMSAVVKTYNYLDEDEIASQQKKKKKKNKKSRAR
jgi:type IV pilus assembly protein PilO